MIDGGAERLEQEFISYLLARPQTMPAELAQHFHLSERSANYWLGCLVKSGRLRIASIEGRSESHAAEAPAVREVTAQCEEHCWSEAVLEVCGKAEAA